MDTNKRNMELRSGVQDGLGQSEPGGEIEEVWLTPGRESRVKFSCARCEGYRWRSVLPARNVRRAIACMNLQDYAAARDYLADVLEELSEFAMWDAPAKTHTDGCEAESPNPKHGDSSD